MILFTDSSSIISLPSLPSHLRGWFPVKWPRARPLETPASDTLPVRKSPRRRWEPHTWLRNFYYSVDPNTGRGRIMAAWLPWEIQIQSVATRLCFWISLNREQMLAQKTGAHHASRRPAENVRNATVTFRSRRVCIREDQIVPSRTNLEQDFVIYGHAMMDGIGYYFSLIDSGSVDSMPSLWNDHFDDDRWYLVSSCWSMKRDEMWIVLEF